MIMMLCTPETKNNLYSFSITISPDQKIKKIKN